MPEAIQFHFDAAAGVLATGLCHLSKLFSRIRGIALVWMPTQSLPTGGHIRLHIARESSASSGRPAKKMWALMLVAGESSCVLARRACIR